VVEAETVPERDEAHGALTRGRYMIVEVGRLTGAGSDRARHWLGRPYAPSADTAKHHRVSFIGLVDLAVVTWMRDRGVSLQAIRRGEARCRTTLGEDQPFATRAFLERGLAPFVGPHGRRPALGGTSILEATKRVIEPALDRLDYGSRFAERWWPLGRGFPIVVDPIHLDGEPAIAGRDVSVRTILDHLAVGLDAIDAASALQIDPEEVEVAVAFHRWQGRHAGT
jgi:uncharacterized protein (DUF433 family)